MTNQLISVLEEAFTSKELHYEARYRTEDESYLFFLPMGGPAGRFNVVCHVKAKEYILRWVASMPTNVPKDGQERVITYLNQQNWQLVLGSWALDPTDGELCFRYSTFIDPEAPTNTDLLLAPLMLIETIVRNEMGNLLKLMFSPAIDPANTTSQAALPFWCN